MLRFTSQVSPIWHLPEGLQICLSPVVYHPCVGPDLIISSPFCSPEAPPPQGLLHPLL